MIMKKKNVNFAENKNQEEKKKPSFARRFFSILFLIILSPVFLLYFFIKWIVKTVKKNKWEKEGKRGKLLLLSADISQIDIMEGYEFEEYLKTLFFYEGFATETTIKARDFGADIILVAPNEKIIVQAKRYSKAVGVKSVQEILGAVPHYRATGAMVVTNSYFTQSAETLAKENNIRLVDRDELIEIYTRVKEKLQLSTRESELVDKTDMYIEDRFPHMI